MSEPNWKIFTGAEAPHDRIEELLKDDPEDEMKCPPWRNFPRRFRAAHDDAEERIKSLRQAPEETDDRGAKFYLKKEPVRRQETPSAAKREPIIEIINAALYLRRPLLVTGKPGTGKSSLIYAVARELKLGQVLRWPITSRSTLSQALYHYDAIGRLQAAQLLGLQGPDTARIEPEIGDYIRLGPLGTALLPSKRPRALLIDEIDKSDVDLPNDLLNILEEGEFEIPELVRLKDKKPGSIDENANRFRSVKVRPHDCPKRTTPDSPDAVTIFDGRVHCYHFPFVVMTSNGDRDFPAPFLRRCLRLNMTQTDDDFREIVKKHLGEAILESAATIINDFLGRKNKNDLATDQLLNAIFMVTRENGPGDGKEYDELLNVLLKDLGAKETG